MTCLLLGMFGLTWTAIDLSKEMKVNQETIVTPSGDPVRVSSSEMTVGANGELMQRPPDGAADPADGAEGRRLSAGAPSVLQTAQYVERVTVELHEVSVTEGDAQAYYSAVTHGNSAGSNHTVHALGSEDPEDRLLADQSDYSSSYYSLGHKYTANANFGPDLGDGGTLRFNFGPGPQG